MLLHKMALRFPKFTFVLPTKLRGMEEHHHNSFHSLARCNMHETYRGESPATLARLCYQSRSCSTISRRPSAFNFKNALPKHFNFAVDVISRWARLEQNGMLEKTTPAFWWIDENGQDLRLSFQQLDEQTQCTANALAKHGIARGDRVLVMLPRVPEWWLLNLACIRIGAVLIPATTQLSSRDLFHRLQRSEAHAIVTDEDNLYKINEFTEDFRGLILRFCVSNSSISGWINLKEEILAASAKHEPEMTRFDEPFTLFFTSGTTAEPKMVEHTHAGYGIGHQVTGRFWLDLKPSDVHWNLSDTGWAKSAWSNLFAPWTQAACVFVYNNQRFQADTVLKLLSKYPVTTFCAPPTAYRLLIQENSSEKPHSLRHCVSAGEPLNPEVTAQWKNLYGMEIREGYGQSETVLVCGSFPWIENKRGSMGIAAPGLDVKVLDDAQRECPPDVEGDLAICTKPEHPLGLFTGYVNSPEQNAKAFVGDYYLTGDRVTVDEDGYFWFVGRSDDVIKSSGYRISPFEVESLLLEHDLVVESAVVGTPDDIRGQAVKAFVVLCDTAGQDLQNIEESLITFLKARTAKYKIPRQFEFVPDLPKTVSGKIRRVELRASEWKKDEQS